MTACLLHRCSLHGRRPVAVMAIVVGLAAGALGGCKSKTPPTDSGPSTTIATVAAAAAADTTVPVGTTLFEAPFYTVVAGDTIGKIATKLGVPAQQLIDANGIARPDKIAVGQKLRVPTGASGAATTTTTTG